MSKRLRPISPKVAAVMFDKTAATLERICTQYWLTESERVSLAGQIQWMRTRSKAMHNIHQQMKLHSQDI